MGCYEESTTVHLLCYPKHDIASVELAVRPHKCKATHQACRVLSSALKLNLYGFNVFNLAYAMQILQLTLFFVRPSNPEQTVTKDPTFM